MYSIAYEAYLENEIAQEVVLFDAIGGLTRYFKKAHEIKNEYKKISPGNIAARKANLQERIDLIDATIKEVNGYHESKAAKIIILAMRILQVLWIPVSWLGGRAMTKNGVSAIMNGGDISGKGIMSILGGSVLQSTTVPAITGTLTQETSRAVWNLIGQSQGYEKQELGGSMTKAECITCLGVGKIILQKEIDKLDGK